MNRLVLLISMAVALQGCDAQKARNTPTQQAEDYKICTDAGMRPYQNMLAEIMCTTPREQL